MITKESKIINRFVQVQSSAGSEMKTQLRAKVVGLITFRLVE